MNDFQYCGDKLDLRRVGGHEQNIHSCNKCFIGWRKTTVTQLLKDN